MNEDKDKKVVKTKTVVVTNVKQESEEELPKKEIGIDDVSKNLDEHLQQNMTSLTKKKVNWKDIVTYIIMGIIVIACLVLIYFFLDKNGVFDESNNTTTTTIDVNNIPTTRTSLPEIKTETTTAAEVRATHISGNREAGNQKNNATTQQAVNVLIEGPTKINFQNVTANTTRTTNANLYPGDYIYKGIVIFTINETISKAEVTCSFGSLDSIPSCTYKQ